MSNRSALMLIVSSIGVALALASCSSEDEVVEGVGGSEAGSSGKSSSVGGSTPKGTSNGGTSASGGAVTTASAGAAGTTPSVTGGATGVGGSQPTSAAGATSTLAAGATGLAGAGGSGGVAGGNATAGTAGIASTDVNTLCTQRCAIQAGVKDESSADCSLGASCMSHCVDPAADPALGASAKAAYLEMLQCEVANLSAADYLCSTTAPVTGSRGPAPRVNRATPTPCAAQICAFNCDEVASMIYGDEVVVNPCACTQQ